MTCGLLVNIIFNQKLNFLKSFMVNTVIKQKKYHKALWKMQKHFALFNEEMGLDMNSPMVIAISGGVDSVVLLDLLISIGVKNLRLLHIDHGTRSQITDEIAMLRDLANSKNIEFQSIKITLNANANFEAQARKLRYQALLGNLREGELLLTGHHLDDCFEWSLMQQLKSSAKLIDLGIPYRNGRIYRPLFAFSKKQILSYAQMNDLHWFEDHTNHNLKYERNFVRNLVTQKIAKRFPQYLKHYCARMNKLKNLKDIKNNVDHKITKRSWGIVVKHKGQLTQAIEEAILSQSVGVRGKTREQFNKLSNLLKTKASIGPLSFSGGIKVYLFGDYLAVTKKSCDILFSKEDAQIPDAIPFLSKQDRVKDSLKKCPLNNASLKKLFPHLAAPVHYSWRKEGKVLVWF